MVAVFAFTILQASQPSPAELATSLFRLAGAESPAGGEYRQVTVSLPTIAFGERKVSLDAWVVTDSLTGARRVIAWNGLAYDPVSVGDTADLEADVAKRRANKDPYLPMESAEYIGAFTCRGPAAAAMLCQFGRRDLAEKVVGEPLFMVSTSPDVRIASATVADRVLCDAAAARIVHGRDYEALLLARRALRFRTAFDEIVDVKGGPAAIPFGPNTREVLQSWVSALNLRIARPHKLPTAFESARMTKSERVAVLVANLDNQTGTRMYIAGEEPPSMDGPAERLLREGDEGMQALFDAMDDATPTRAIYGNAVPTGPYRFASVGEVAVRTVEGVIGLSGFGPSPEAKHDQMLRLWNATKGRSLEERWLAALEDDAMPVQVWDAAARGLSAPSWVTVSVGGYSIGNGLPQHFTGPSIKWTNLYKSKRARVFRALEKRALFFTSDLNKYGVYAHSTTLAAAVYDSKRALPLLRAVRADVLHDAKRAEGPVEYDLRKLASVVSAMVSAGAPDAWDGYEELVAKVKPTGLRADLDRDFAPLWEHPDDPTSVRLAATVFGAGQPWSVAELVSDSPSTTLPVVSLLRPFQDALLAGLRDRGVVVTAQRTSPTFLRYESPSGRGTRGVAIKAETASVEVGGTIELRRCDLLMDKLKGAFRANGFDIGATLAERDKWIGVAIEAMSGEAFVWEVNPVPMLAVTEPVFVSRAIWPAPIRRVRPGTFGR